MPRKRIDLTGQRFGKLVVLEPAENIGKKTAWHCLCDCGKETIVSSGHLRGGETKSCGCLQYEYHGSPTPRLDLTGQRFGKLVALEPAESVGGRTTWRCRCDCGKETVVRVTNLRSGRTKSCGCLQHEYHGSPTPRLDLTGQRFGKLVVLEPAENIGRKTAWHCLCDCGQECVVMSGHLRNGTSKSCGCGRNRLDGSEPTRIDGTCIEHLRSKKLYRNNTSGVRGVSWSTRDQRWSAYINFKGMRYLLGFFSNFEDAVAARKKAEAEMYGTFLEKYDAAQAEEKGVVGCQNAST